MKISLVCHVKNSFEYIPIFLAHHENLFDEIHIIDQCSDIELRDMSKSEDKVFFYKTSYGFFNAMVGTNAVIEYRSLREKNDFVFVLDIDEFLPFSSRGDFEHFLAEHKNADAIRFYWRNGMNFDDLKDDFSFLSIKNKLLFFKERSSVFKLAYNAKKTRWFLPYHGNHSAKFNFMKFVACKKKHVINESHLPIYHIPFSSVGNLQEKVNSFDKVEFFDKIISRHEITKSFFSRLEDNNLTVNDLCFFVANYRTIGREPLISAMEGDFVESCFWGDCGERIDFWSEELRKCKSLHDSPAFPRCEKKVRSILGDYTWLGRYFFYQSICSKLFIDDNNMIQLR